MPRVPIPLPRPDRRLFVVAGLTTLVAPATAAAAHRGAERYDALVGAPSSALADRDYDSLEAALEAAKAADASVPFRIWLGPGAHYGQFLIDRPKVEIHGSGAGRTTLYFDAAAGHTAPDGRPYGTFRTWCVQVTAPDVRLHGLTIANTFDAPAEMRRLGGMRSDEGGSQQAIALSLARGADRTLVTDCDLASHQDTVYCASGRAFFRDCLISGSYDFIFGGAAALFERCEIRSLPRLDPVEGYIAAPNTSADQPVGLTFDNCRLTAAPGVPDGSVFLARPWGASTRVDGRRVRTVGMATYLRCDLGRHIAPGGWTRMWFTAADGASGWFEPEFARFAEYRNTGPGAVAPGENSPRRGRELIDEEARDLSRRAMFGEWRPSV